MLQATLAMHLGVSPQSVSLYETGKNRVPDDVAAKIARLWGMREVDVRRSLGLYVPGDLDEADQTSPAADPYWPDAGALRLPGGIQLSDLDPHHAKALETIVDAFLKSVTRQESEG